MTRPKKQTVDYFPHYCTHGKTIFILEQRYGNDGYAFWFKLLELLGTNEGHYLDLNDATTCEFMASKTKIASEVCEEILKLLAKLSAIDSELWAERIIWSQNFVNGISDAYRNRISEIPKRPDNLRKKPLETQEKAVKNPHTILDDTILKETRKTNTPPGNGKSKPIPLPPDFKISEATLQWAKKKGYDHLEDYLEYFRDWAIANGKRYLDWDATFRNCVRGDWGKIKEQKQKGKEARL